MVVVEKPFAGWTDLRVLGGGRQTLVSGVEDFFCFDQPGEEWCRPPEPSPATEALRPRDSSRPLGELVGAEQFATDRTRREIR
jgi:hypothetical protein